jgi:hypothetical protein
MKSWIFWTAWAIGALAAVPFVYFFMVGLGDGTVSSFNIVEWLGILGGFVGVLGGSLWLKSQSLIAAIILALVLAVPALLALLFFLVILITNPRMN